MPDTIMPCRGSEIHHWKDSAERSTMRLPSLQDSSHPRSVEHQTHHHPYRRTEEEKHGQMAATIFHLRGGKGKDKSKSDDVVDR